MLPSVEDIIARRRILSAKYEAQKRTTKKLSHSQANFCPISTSNPMVSDSLHGLEYHGEKYHAPIPFIQEITDKDRKTCQSIFEQHSDGEPFEQSNGSCNSPRIAMQLPSVEDIVARRKKLPSDNTSYSQLGKTLTILDEKEEPVAPELVRALEAVGWCPTPRGSTPRKKSLDNLSLLDEMMLDELLSNKEDYNMDLLQIDQAKVDKRPPSINTKSKICTRSTQQVGHLAAPKVNPFQKSYNTHEVEDKSRIKKQDKFAQLSSNKANENETLERRIRMDPHKEPQELEYTSDHGEQEKNILSIFPPRDCNNTGLKKQKRCTGVGLRRHMVLVPPPKRRVDLSELYVNEVVLVKRDRSVWVFAQLKMLTCRGIRAWVPCVHLYINIPIEIMYTHLRKVEDDEELKGLPEFTACDEDHNKEQRTPLPTTFDTGKNFRMISHQLPKRQQQLHLVRPAHLAHRILHQPIESTLPCTICFRLMSLMDAHKPWDCEHSCHLFCYQLALQGSNSISCNMCSVGKSWDWKTIKCQCGFLGFLQKRDNDLESTLVCPSCLKPSLILNLYQSSSECASELALQSNHPSISSNTNVNKLMTSPFQRSSTLEEWNTSSKLSKQAISFQELDWRHVKCECGLQGMIRTSEDSSKLPMCPACFNPIKEWCIPNKDDLLKALLGYTPTDSPTNASTPSLQPTSPLSYGGRSSSKIDHTPTSISSDFSLFDGLKHSKSSPSTLFTPNNTPSFVQSVLSSNQCDQSENSSYMSSPNSPQNNSPPSLFPPREPMYISSTDTMSISSTPELIKQMMMEEEVKQVSNLMMAENQSPSLIRKQAPPTMFKRSFSTESMSMKMTPELIKQMMMNEECQEEEQDQNSMKSAPRFSHLEISKPPMQPVHLPTDSISMWMTTTKIKSITMEEQHRQEQGKLKLLSKLTKKHLPTDSASLWLTPSKIKQMIMTEKKICDYKQYSSLTLEDEIRRPISTIKEEPDDLDEEKSELIKQMIEEELQHQEQDSNPLNKQLTSIYVSSQPTHLKKTSQERTKKSSSVDSISMLMTPELIKQMMMKKELKQEQEPSSSIKLMTSIKEISKPKQTSSIMLKEKSSSNSISMGMTPEFFKLMMREEELRQQEQDSNSSSSTPKLANSSIQIGRLPIGSTSMWRTPTKNEKIAMEEESSNYQNQPKSLHKVIKHNLPTDSASLWLTPTKVKQMAMMEEKICRHKQDSLIILGDEFQRPISTIEEESKGLNEEDSTTFYKSDSSLSTQLESYHFTHDKVKKTQEPQEDSQFNLGFISESSRSEDYIQKTNDVREYHSRELFRLLRAEHNWRAIDVRGKPKVPSQPKGDISSRHSDP